MAGKKTWKQVVQEADQDRNKEVDVYIFAKGKRKFKDRRDPYESAK